MRKSFWAGAVAACLLLPAGAGLAAVAGESRGPLNLLLVGIDPRDEHTAPLADTIIVAHIPADRRGAFLFSLPRDLVVRIPAFAPSGTPAQRTKINAAMGLGSRVGPDRFSPAQGLELLGRTVGELTGIARFDAGAVLDFGGFTRLIRAVGGVRMVIDQDVVSEHRKPDGSPRDRLPECRTNFDCPRPYTGPQKTYVRGDTPVRLKAWEALDYVRQRYGLPGSDYDRQRHQRQLVTALARQVGDTVTTDPGRLLETLSAIDQTFTFEGSGRTFLDWVVALKHLRAGDLTTIGLPGEPLFEGGRYRGERLPDRVGDFFAAVAADRVAPFLADHPGLVRVDQPPPSPAPALRTGEPVHP